MSTVLFGYTPDHHSLLETLLRCEASRPLYLMPGDGRKSTAVRSVPILPHQINEMTDFALTHQAETVWILNGDSLRAGAADDSRAMGLKTIGPGAAGAGKLRLKDWRAFALSRSLPLLTGKSFPSSRAAAAAALSLPALALSPWGEEILLEGSGYRDILRLKRYTSLQGEWLVCPVPAGEQQDVTVRLRDGVPEILHCPEGAEPAAECLAAWMQSLRLTDPMFVSLSLHRSAEGWLAGGIAPLPGRHVQWTKEMIR